MITVARKKVLSLPAFGAAPAAVVYRAGLAVDADGAPNAYGPDDSGLDFTANAGHPARSVPCAVCAGSGRVAVTGGPDVVCGHCSGTGWVKQPANWWGVVTDTGSPEGEPIVQGDTDPCPGLYVSSTSLADPGYRRTDPRRYVDASVVPFISVPPGVVALGVRMGDVGAVCLEVVGDDGAVAGYKMAAAVVADRGPPNAIGEGSVALAQLLGLPANPRGNPGPEPRVVWVLFPGSRSTPSWPRAVPEFTAQVDDLFAAFGGYARASAALAAV